MTPKSLRSLRCCTIWAWQKAFDGPLRFEVEGANAARAFARNEGVDDRRAQLIWDGVALNSTVSIALYKEAEVALSTAGIGLDWGGFGYDMVSKDQVAAIVDAFPRLEMKQRFTRAVCGIVEMRPDTTYDNFAAISANASCLGTRGSR